MKSIRFLDQTFRVLSYWCEKTSGPEWYDKPVPRGPTLYDYVLRDVLPMPLACNSWIFVDCLLLLFDVPCPKLVYLLPGVLFYMIVYPVMKKYYNGSKRYMRLIKRKGKIERKWFVISTAYFLSPLMLALLFLALVL